MYLLDMSEIQISNYLKACRWRFLSKVEENPCEFINYYDRLLILTLKELLSTALYTYCLKLFN